MGNVHLKIWIIYKRQTSFPTSGSTNEEDCHDLEIFKAIDYLDICKIFFMIAFEFKLISTCKICLANLKHIDVYILNHSEISLLKLYNFIIF